ncbi:MAG: ABC1 kinase family protein [Gammaproteobacteria bacterium]
MSTRPDLIAPPLAQALARLRDNCQPLQAARIRQTIEQELGADISSLFDRFENTPLAAASLAQVHEVECDGRKQVIKVLRPHIERRVEQDLRLVSAAFHWAHRQLGSRMRLPEIFQDYALIVRGECDLMLEAARTTRMRRNAERHNMLKIARIYWPYTTRRVMTAEYISGIPVTHTSELKKSGVDMKELAETGVRIFFTQVFQDNFFHGDMHPGNIMVRKDTAPEPVYAAVDCAITGHLGDTELTTLARILQAILNSDFQLAAEKIKAAGWVSAETRDIDLGLAIQAACEPLLDQPLEQMDFGQLLTYLFAAGKTFGMIMQPSMALLIKTLINIEGMGRQIYPQLNIWNIARSELQRWRKRRFSPAAVLARHQKEFEQNIHYLTELPARIHRLTEPVQRATRARTSHLHTWGLGLLLILTTYLLTLHANEILSGLQTLLHAIGLDARSR